MNAGIVDVMLQQVIDFFLSILAMKFAIEGFVCFWIAMFLIWLAGCSYYKR